MKDYFSYYDASDIIPSTTFRISPSQLSKFFDDTTNWYRENLLGESGFQGNTSTELGTCVHAAAHMYHDTNIVDYQAIDEYIDNITTPDVDKLHIKKQYPTMITALIDQHLSQVTGTEAEIFLHKEILPDIIVGGSIDRYDASTKTLRDYKTTGSLDKARIPTKLPRNYWFQQLTYAWLLRKSGYAVNTIELVYISQDNTGRFNDKGKPLKDYPSTVNTLVHPITQEELDIIESIIKLVADSVHTWRTNPELQYLLAQDYRLKPKPKPSLFID